MGRDTANAAAIPATTGQWALPRNWRAKTAAMAAPSSGRNGMSQTRLITAPLPGLAGVGRLDARGDQVRVRLGPGLRLGRLRLGDRVVRDRRLSRLADLLPERHVERGLPLE